MKRIVFTVLYIAILALAMLLSEPTNVHAKPTASCYRDSCDYLDTVQYGCTRGDLVQSGPINVYDSNANLVGYLYLFVDPGPSSGVCNSLWATINVVGKQWINTVKNNSSLIVTTYRCHNNPVSCTGGGDDNYSAFFAWIAPHWNGWHDGPMLGRDTESNCDWMEGEVQFPDTFGHNITQFTAWKQNC